MDEKKLRAGRQSPTLMSIPGSFHQFILQTFTNMVTLFCLPLQPFAAPNFCAALCITKTG